MCCWRSQWRESKASLAYCRFVMTDTHERGRSAPALSRLTADVLLPLARPVERDSSRDLCVRLSRTEVVVKIVCLDGAHREPRAYFHIKTASEIAGKKGVARSGNGAGRRGTAFLSCSARRASCASHQPVNERRNL